MAFAVVADLDCTHSGPPRSLCHLQTYKTMALVFEHTVINHTTYCPVPRSPSPHHFAAYSAETVDTRPAHLHPERQRLAAAGIPDCPIAALPAAHQGNRPAVLPDSQADHRRRAAARRDIRTAPHLDSRAEVAESLAVGSHSAVGTPSRRVRRCNPDRWVVLRHIHWVLIRMFKI